MNVTEFSLLNEQQQSELLNLHEIIATRADENYQYFLYQIEDFYAEVVFTQSNYRIGIITFQSTKLLEPYLLGVDISGIIKAIRG